MTLLEIHTAIKTKPCPKCHQQSEISLTAEEVVKLAEWRDGGFIQTVFPDWPVEKRELLITGYHDDCWNEDMGVWEEDNWDGTTDAP